MGLACASYYLMRVGLGQNIQLPFISGEQLSLNVASDSAKTLSVLEIWGVLSMIMASHLCRGGGAPLKIPPILGSNGIFLEILKIAPQYGLLGPNTSGFALGRVL